jgi:hypothetical protein
MKTYKQKMRYLENRDRENPVLHFLFTEILSGNERDRIEKRLLQDGKETLQIEFEVWMTSEELQLLRSIGSSKIKEYLETKFRSDQIGKSYPGIDNIKYAATSGILPGIRIMLTFEGTPVPE